MQGVKAVTKALGVFEKIRKQLTGAICKCVDEISDLEADMSDLRADITDLNLAKDKALKVLEALDKILGE